MSSEMRTLLANAAPQPSSPLDVGSIMKRGRRVRSQRVMATILVIPLVVGALWTGARAGLDVPIPKTPPAGPYCDWTSKTLTVFLVADAKEDDVVELTRRVRALEHVASARWIDLFEKGLTFKARVPNLLNRVARNGFAPWLDIVLTDARHAGDVANALPDSPLIDEVAGGRMRSAECRVDGLKKQNDELERQVRRLEKQLARARRKARR